MTLPRFLTPDEQVIAKKWWPHLDLSGPIVTGEQSVVYNCLAWTLGFEDRWLWPWRPIDRKVTRAEFDELYLTFSFVPSGLAPKPPIAVFGMSSSDMKHGSVSGPTHGRNWESKCGQWLRIQHGLYEMAGGSYGDVLGFYSPRAPAVAAHDIREKALSALTESLKLTDNEIGYLGERVQAVDADLKRRFDEAYAAWKDTWNHPLIAASSAPGARAQSIQYLELVSLGERIIPLLMNRLTNRDEFFALVALEPLLRPELVVTTDLKDDAVLLGEQGRAAETLKRWILAIKK